MEVSDFFSQNSLVFTTVSIVLVVSVLLVIIIFGVQDFIQTEEVDNLYILEQEYDNWTENFDSENNDSEEIIERVSNFSFRSGGYADIRRKFILGNIYEQIGEFDTAVQFFEEVSNRGRGYLVSLAILKTALLFEELEDISRAEDIYLQYINEFDAPDEPRVLLTLGRISESKNEYSQAEIYYNIIIDEYSSSDWRNFAYNRLIDLRSKGIIE